MAKKQLHKSKGNFTIKRLHQSGGYGNIYERDYTTIIPSFTPPKGQLQIHNGPSFKLTVGNNVNVQKKYRHNDWISNTCNDTNAWNLGCIPVPNSKDSEIVLKPSKSQITDYVCYGSAYELINSSLRNIIANFPAEMYASGDRTLEIENILEMGDIDTSSELYLKQDVYKKYSILENTFNIDILQSVLPEKITVSKLRYFCESQYDYVLMNEKDEIIFDASELKKWNIEHPNRIKKWWHVDYEPDKDCLVNGDKLATVSLYKYMKNTSDDSLLPVGSYIIYCFYYNGDILYLISIENGKKIKIRPNKKMVNKFFNELNDFERLLLNQYTNYSANFETYKEDDETGWYMTNETYQWPTDNGWNIEIYGLSYSKYIDSLSKLAMSYDTLFTNAIWNSMTHEAINNMDLTDKFTTDYDVTYNPAKMKKILNVIGRQFDEIKKYIDNIKNTNTITYDQNKNIPDYFMSDSLELSGWETKQILSDIPEDVLTEPMYGAYSLGFKASDANIEFMRRLKLNSKNILSAKGTKRCIEDLLAVFGFHSKDWLEKYYPNPGSRLKKSYIMKEFVYVAYGYNKINNFNSNINDYIDAVKRINQLKNSYTNDGIESPDNYVDEFQGLPVVEVEYNGKRTIVPWFDKEKKYDTELYFQMKGGWSRNNGENGNVGVYECTISKLRAVRDINELFNINYSELNQNDIYYVYDEQKYYKLVDINNYNNSNGWGEPTEKEIEELESIIDENKGNNPHYGDYDGGSSYIDAMGNLFKYSEFNEYVSDDDIQGKEYLGFTLKRVRDNMKTMFFANHNQGFLDEIKGLRGDITLKPSNLFGENELYNEPASLSVVNCKEFEIVFDKTHRNFIENDVLPYLKQIIPSTTIFSYSFDDVSEHYDFTKAEIEGTVEQNNTYPIYGVVDNE